MRLYYGAIKAHKGVIKALLRHLERGPRARFPRLLVADARNIRNIRMRVLPHSLASRCCRMLVLLLLLLLLLLRS